MIRGKIMFYWVHLFVSVLIVRIGTVWVTNLYQFFLLHVSALVESNHQAIKNTQEIQWIKPVKWCTAATDITLF
jgi:hypothetical protein